MGPARSAPRRSGRPSLFTVLPATLFKVNLDAGHGGASARYDYLREIAFDCEWIIVPRS